MLWGNSFTDELIHAQLSVNHPNAIWKVWILLMADPGAQCSITGHLSLELLVQHRRERPWNCNRTETRLYQFLLKCTEINPQLSKSKTEKSKILSLTRSNPLVLLSQHLPQSELIHIVVRLLCFTCVIGIIEMMVEVEVTSFPPPVHLLPVSHRFFPFFS